MVMGENPRIVFWVVFIVLIIPAGWFIGSSFVGLQEILTKLHHAQSNQTVKLFESHYKNERFATNPLIVKAHLEYDTLWDRQGRTISFIATRTWLRFMSSTFGAIMIFVGAVFLLARIETEPIEGDVSSSDLTASLKTSSPGIIFAIIGACLMVFPNAFENQITTIDGASYLVPSEKMKTLEPYIENTLLSPNTEMLLDTIARGKE